MAKLTSIIAFMDTLLEQSKYQDASQNGVQVGGCDADVKSIAYSVDSGLSIIQKSIDLGVGLLIVHHGIFWDKPLTITGPTKEKVELLLKHKCTLYASHLPLDGNYEVGNAFMLGRFLNVHNLEGFLEYKGATIGARGTINSQKLNEIVAQISKIPEAGSPLVLPFGKDVINSVAIITGSAAFAIPDVAKAGIDLLITGEPKQEAYHLAKELGINVIFAGHYTTETFGVAALAKKVAERFDVKAIFIDEPTGI